MSAGERSRRTKPSESNGLPQELPEEHLHRLSVTVLFTTFDDTLHALRRAAQLAQELGARIEILVPSVVPYPLPLEKPRTDPEFRLRQFQTCCEQVSVETRLHIRLCRDVRQCVRDSLRPHSLIVIARRHSWRPLAYEKRLARELAGAGHQVVLVDAQRPR